MTTKERLHRLVDDLSEGEAQAALHLIASRRADADPPEEPVAIVLDDAEAQRFLDALDDPAAFEPGLRRLVERPGVLGE